MNRDKLIKDECSGAIFDRYGLCALIVPGSLGMVASMMCLSVSTGERQDIIALARSPADPVTTEYYQFVLSFGVLGGLSACCLFTPSVSTIGHWFSKRQGLATGIACTAGGIGGVIFSFMTLYLTPIIGFAWTMRAIGFVCAGLCAVACVTLQTRDISGTSSPRAEAEGLLKCLSRAVDIKPFAYDYPYLATTTAVFLIELALFVPLTYISSAAIATGQGLDQENAYRLIGFLNVGSIPGRVLPGYLADRFGRFNVMVLTALVCAALITCVWLPPIAIGQASEPAFIAFAVFFGFWSGAAISLTPVCIAQVSKVEEIGSRVGTVFSISSIGALIGVPIGGAVIDQSGGAYTGLVVFSAALYMLALVGFIAARFIAGPKQIVARY